MKLILSLFWQHILKYPGIAAILGITTVLSTAAWVVEPLYTSYAIDELTSVLQGEIVNYPRVFGWWAAVFIFASVVNGFDKYYTWKFRNILKMDRREDIYRHLLKLDVHFHINQRSGEIVKKMEDGADELRRIFSILIDFVPSIFSSLIFITVSISISWLLTLILIVGISLYILVSLVLSSRIAKLDKKISDLWIISTGRASDVIANIFTMKSSGREHDEYERMRASNSEALVAQSKVNKAWAWLESVNFYALIRIALIGVGTILLVRGKLTLGELYYFQFVFFRILTPFEMLSNFLPEWNQTMEKIRYGQDILNTTIDVSNRPHAKRLESLQGSIEFQSVHFSYGKAVDTIQDISFTINPGEHIALVGHSGAGKSTIAMLLNRFYDVTSGTVLINDTDIRDLDVHWLRQRIGLVLQENIMFNDTLLENIRYSRPDATNEEVEEAARRASAMEFIERLPNKFNTLVGERGIKLSGGERQRVAIARAILKKPDIVVLDEATSALDSVTEKTVQEGIKGLIEGRTAVIIAHRLSTVRSVDRIAVMENGRVTAFAPHEELMKTSPIYKQMVELQREGMLAE